MTYSEFDDEFDRAPTADFQTVPPGVYQVYVDRAIFDQPDWADYPRLQLTVKILDGEYKGQALFPSGDCNPEYIKYMKGMLVKMGFDPPPKPSELNDEKLREMLDRILEVKVSANRTRPEYPKVYINRFLRWVGDDPDEPPPHDDRDYPRF